jgi:hypothetical protein
MPIPFQGTHKKKYPKRLQIIIIDNQGQIFQKEVQENQKNNFINH